MHSVWDDVNFYESEGDCTSEMGAGQFSIFGAVEEKGRRGTLPEERDEVKGESTHHSASGWRWFSRAQSGGERIGCRERAEYPQRAHRKCRKAVAVSCDRKAHLPAKDSRNGPPSAQ